MYFIKWKISEVSISAYHSSNFMNQCIPNEPTRLRCCSVANRNSSVLPPRLGTNVSRSSRHSASSVLRHARYQDTTVVVSQFQLERQLNGVTCLYLAPAGHRSLSHSANYLSQSSSFGALFDTRENVTTAATASTNII